jgi:hypothetical protein
VLLLPVFELSLYPVLVLMSSSILLHSALKFEIVFKIVVSGNLWTTTDVSSTTQIALPPPDISAAHILVLYSLE